MKRCQEVGCKCDCANCVKVRKWELTRNNDPDKMFCSAVCLKENPNVSAN